tara:strand:- start:1859 stop:2461 length:603 start_codon:yes stop_codon:yes gene_type:complete
MEKIYSAKIVYKNYLDYLGAKIFNRQFLLLFILTFVVLFFIGAFGKTIYFLQNPGASTIEEALLEILGSTIKLTLIFLAIPILASYAFWLQNFYFSGNKIIDNFPRRKELLLTQLEYILLESPYQAGLIFQRPQDNLKTVVYWHGKDEREWLDFLAQLQANNPSIDEKIYFKTSFLKGNKRVKSNIINSYKEILKMHDIS